MFRKKKMPIPESCEGLKIKVMSSTCTGERIIGFYDRKTRELKYSELVESESDIARFYEKYGLKHE